MGLNCSPNVVSNTSGVTNAHAGSQASQVAYQTGPPPYSGLTYAPPDFMMRQVLLLCDRTRDLYPVTAPSLIPHVFLVSQHTWHQRLGHPGSDVLHRVVSNIFISCNKEKPPILCHACQLGKHARLLFVSSNTVVTSCFDIIHSDVWTSPIRIFQGLDTMTSVNTKSKLVDDGDSVYDPTLYWSLAGSLEYLTFTRPDISYAVQHVCLYMHDPWEPHFSAHKRVLRYVRASTALSRSSSEAEYRGVANVVAETCWLRNLLRELHTPLSFAMLVYSDNVSAVYLSSNPAQHQRTKHIEIDIYFVRDLVAAGQVRVLHVPSLYQHGTHTAYLLLYVDNIVLTASSKTLTSVNTKSKLVDDGDSIYDPTLYWSLAGSLEYLTFTRPDISYAVQQSRSSAEAEYRGVVNVVAETCWLRNLLRELHTPLSFAMLVYSDNVSVVYLSSNPAQHHRTKHIEIDIYFVRDLVAAGQVRVLHVPSLYQYAYIFTKGLPSDYLRSFAPV
nr:ribonuclease H-like domain-containing protein [Tanacetum cinerariifolium]